MSDSAAALSVLVLAWDEAAPTVRTVVEAAPAVGALLVLLPPALPLAPASLPAPLAPASAPSLPVAPAVAAASPAPPAPEPAAEVAAATTGAARPALALGSQSLAVVEPAAATPAAPRPPAAPAVRVLHVVAAELPATRRSGTFQVPAAPYLGASPPPTQSAPAAATGYVLQTLTTGLPPAPSAAPAPGEWATSEQKSQPASASRAATELLPAAAPRPATPAEAAPAAPDPAAAPAPTLPLAAAAFAADEIVDPNPEEELLPLSQSPAAATPADSLHLSDPAPTRPLSLGPFGNRLPQLDTAPGPSARPAPAPKTPETSVPEVENTPQEQASTFAASVAAARQYTAPDLNSQVIRYARLAVPLALAEGSYEVIYAPAWPTWLAALELRQRTLGPLVLHLPALAAGRQPADTAAGWPAELQRQALRQADLVLVETYALARRLRRELGLGPATVRVVPTADAAAVARALRRARRRPGLA